MKDFLTRAFSALIFVAVMIGCLLWNVWSFAFIMLAIMLGSLFEFYKISRDKRFILSPFSKSRSRNMVMILSVIMLFLSFFMNGGLKDLVGGDGLVAKVLNMLLSRKFTFADVALLFPVAIMIIFIHELFSKADLPFTNIGWNLIALCYITLPVIMSFQIYFEQNKYVLLGVIALVWINDAMAYCSGMLFGRTKLIERLSPKKTVEGFIGGIVLTAVSAYLFSYITWEGLRLLSTAQWVTLSVVIAFTATAGDLVESMLKRSLGVKDSGFIMPGHGGFLDRFDAFFIALPFAAITIWLMLQIRYVVTLVEYLG